MKRWMFWVTEPSNPGLSPAAANAACRQSVRHFEVSSAAVLEDLLRLVASPINAGRREPPVPRHRPPPIVILYSYKWCCSELVQLSIRLHELLHVLAVPVHPSSVDIGSNIDRAQRMHTATVAVGKAMTDAIKIIATAFENPAGDAPASHLEFCHNTGPILTAEWMLMIEALKGNADACVGALQYLRFLALHGEDIELSADGFLSRVPAVERGLRLNTKRVTRLAARQQKLLASIACIDQRRGKVSPPR